MHVLTYLLTSCPSNQIRTFALRSHSRVWQETSSYWRRVRAASTEDDCPPTCIGMGLAGNAYPFMLRRPLTVIQV